MIAQVRSELLKFRSTRTAVGLGLGMVALELLFVLLGGLVGSASGLASTQDQRHYLGLGSIAGLFAALAGILVITGEFRFGTIRPTFVFTPQRWRVLTAKVAASLIGGLVLGAVAEALGYGIGRIILSARGIPSALSGRDVALLWIGTVGGAALWGAIGVGVGAIFRNQVASVIGLLAWLFIVENLLFGLVPSVGRWVPGQAQNALSGFDDEHLLSPAVGGLVLLAWALGLAVLGTVLVSRRDVD